MYFKMTPTNTRILAEKAMDKPCSQQCVDWALSLIDQDHAEPSVCALAYKVPPFDHLEIAALRDQVLSDLNRHLA